MIADTCHRSTIYRSVTFSQLKTLQTEVFNFSKFAERQLDYNKNVEESHLKNAIATEFRSFADFSMSANKSHGILFLTKISHSFQTSQWVNKN